MPPTEQLVYRSRSRITADDADALRALVTVSAARNLAAGVTGVLALHQGAFVQILEGSPAALDDLILRLHFDTRHEDMHVMDRARVPRRSFEGWSMTAPNLSADAAQEVERLLASQTQTVEPYRALFVRLLTHPEGVRETV